MIDENDIMPNAYIVSQAKVDGAILYGKRPTNWKEVERNGLVLAVLTLKKLNDERIQYTDFLGNQINSTIEGLGKDVANLELLARLKFIFMMIYNKYPNNTILHCLYNVVDHFVNAYNSSISHEQIRPHLYILEQCIDILYDYSTTEMVGVVEKICDASLKEEYFSNICSCVLKGFIILGNIETEEALGVAKKYLNHPVLDIQEEAEELVEFLEAELQN